MTDINQTAEVIRQKAGDYFSAFKNKTVEVIRLPFQEASTYPIHLLEIRSKELTKKVIVKYAPANANYCEGMIEYTNMKNMAAKREGNPENIGLINCLDYITEHNALVMEFNQGARFSKWFMENNAYFIDLKTRNKVKYFIESAGSWLKLFHRNNPYPKVNVSESGLGNRLSTLIVKAEGLGLLNKQSNKIKESITSTLIRTKDRELPMALLHGDYGLQNMNVDERSLYVFDLQRDYEECIYQDIAYFWVTLDTINSFPKYPLFSKSRSKNLQKDFLFGYFSRQLTKEELVLLNIYIVLNLIQRCIKQYHNNKKRFKYSLPLLTVVLNYQFTRKINKMLFEID